MHERIDPATDEAVSINWNVDFGPYAVEEHENEMWRAFAAAALSGLSRLSTDKNYWMEAGNNLYNSIYDFSGRVEAPSEEDMSTS